MKHLLSVAFLAQALVAAPEFLDMCDLKLRAAWSLNDAVVPFVETTLNIVDPLELTTLS